MELKFNIIAEGNIYFIPRFIRCEHCNHEIPIGHILDRDIEILGLIIDHGGCGKASELMHYAKYFGVIKNVT